MENDKLEKAIKLKEQIKELGDFLYLARRDGWWGKLTMRKKKMVFQETIQGLSDSTFYTLSDDLEKRVISVLEDELGSMKLELEKL